MIVEKRLCVSVFVALAGAVLLADAAHAKYPIETYANTSSAMRSGNNGVGSARGADVSAWSDLGHEFTDEAPTLPLALGQGLPGCTSSDAGEYSYGGVQVRGRGRDYTLQGMQFESEDGTVSTGGFASGFYKVGAGRVTFDDHPTEKDSVGVFLGGSYMLGSIMPRKTRKGKGKHTKPVEGGWTNIPGVSGPGDMGGQAGLEIDFPGLDELGKTIKNQLAERAVGRDTATDLNWSNPAEVDLAQLDWPEFKLSGTLMAEMTGKYNFGGGGFEVGTGYGSYETADVSLNCLAEVGASWADARVDDIKDGYNEIMDGIGDIADGLAEDIRPGPTPW